MSTRNQASYNVSNLPGETWIGGPPHTSTASAPATAIFMSAQDTNKDKRKFVDPDQIITYY